MLVIFYRKGFDSSSGGVPSSMFPDGKMLEGVDQILLKSKHATKERLMFCFFLGVAIPKIIRINIKSP